MRYRLLPSKKYFVDCMWLYVVARLPLPRLAASQCFPFSAVLGPRVFCSTMAPVKLLCVACNRHTLRTGVLRTEWMLLQPLRRTTLFAFYFYFCPTRRVPHYCTDCAFDVISGRLRVLGEPARGRREMQGCRSTSPSSPITGVSIILGAPSRWAGEGGDNIACSLTEGPCALLS